MTPGRCQPALHPSERLLSVLSKLMHFQTTDAHFSDNRSVHSWRSGSWTSYESSYHRNNGGKYSRKDRHPVDVRLDPCIWKAAAYHTHSAGKTSSLYSRTCRLPIGSPFLPSSLLSPLFFFPPLRLFRPTPGNTVPGFSVHSSSPWLQSPGSLCCVQYGPTHRIPLPRVPRSVPAASSVPVSAPVSSSSENLLAALCVPWFLGHP